ncbi:MAG: hypothetical protein ACTSYZ_03440, partial [Candidatus Helarchaeota archaeon]
MGLKESFSRIIKLLYKEFSLIKGDKRALFMALALPPLIISAFGFVGVISDIEGTPINCAVITYDSLGYYYPQYNTTYYNSTWDSVFINMFNNGQFPRLKLKIFYNASEDPYSMHEARLDLASDKVDLIILIPAEFSEAIDLGFPAIIDNIPDGSNIETIKDSLNLMYSATNIFVETNNITPQINMNSRPVYGVPQNANEIMAWAST